MSEKIVSLSQKREKKKSEKAEKEQITEKQTIKEEPLRCSFCNRPSTQVLKLVRGPGVNICSECAMIVVQYLILEDKMPSGEAQKILDAFWKMVSHDPTK